MIRRREMKYRSYYLCYVLAGSLRHPSRRELHWAKHYTTPR